jgi:hypothetical protein
VTNTVFIHSLSCPENIHGSAIKFLNTSQLLNHINLRVDCVICVARTEGTGTKLIHSSCKNLISLNDDGNMAIRLSQIQSIIRRNILTEVINVFIGRHFLLRLLRLTSMRFTVSIFWAYRSKQKTRQFFSLTGASKKQDNFLGLQEQAKIRRFYI